MSIPPPLSSDSVDRMSRVVEQADAAVDEGVPPAEAIAKAAQEHKLPIGHVPFVVRSFNTGRAVRQLGEADPWSKAANYPSTTAAEVCAVLESPAPSTTPKTAADADYDLPPDAATVKAAAVAKYALPTMTPSAWTKAAAARLIAPEVGHAPPPLRPGTIATKAAEALDGLRDLVLPMGLSEYAAVKVAAEQVWPVGAIETFEFLEGQNPRLGYKAAAAVNQVPDPTVTTTHPAVTLVSAVRLLRESYQEPVENRPLGFEKVAHAPGWYVPKKVPGTVSVDDLGPKPEEPVTIGGIFKDAADLAPAAPPSRTATGDWAKNKAKPSSGGFVGGLQEGFFGGLSKVTNNALAAPALDVRVSPSVGDEPDKLRGDLGTIDETAALQSIVADPRLATSDPKVLIETYQSLSRLAPNVMKNQAVASDLLHRRVQTGPLSSFDLKTLIDMEKAYVTGRERHARPAEDDDY